MPELPWYGWVIIAGIISVTIFLKLPVYKNICKKKQTQEEDID